jgi:anti-sigma factor RsiW
MAGFIKRRFGRKQVDNEHAEIRGLSSDYIDGELDEEQVDRVKAHLDKCHLCDAFFNTLRATVSLLANAKRAGAPHSFRERLLERLRREGAR